jgi:RNA polymerase sigma-70 factor (ECF subfamily)
MFASSHACEGRVPTPDEPVVFVADLELLEAVARGDRIAAERFARRVFPFVRKVARALVSDRAEADDACQLALIEVLRAAGSYRGAGAIEAWTRKIASRVVIRSMQRHRAHDPEPASPEITDELPDEALASATFDELPRPLEVYLAELSEVQRTALVLRHALGHTVPEIAELTGAPVPTVKSRLKKAHQEVRRLVRRDVTLGTRGVASTS